MFRIQFQGGEKISEKNLGARIMFRMQFRSADKDNKDNNVSDKIYKLGECL